MVPMRSVPHRVVCLLGWRTGPFRGPQRSTATTSLPRDPVTGELDVRSQDQYLLLDAVMTANEKLVLVSTAANPGTGQERPPRFLATQVARPFEHTITQSEPSNTAEGLTLAERCFTSRGPPPRRLDQRTSAAGRYAKTRSISPRCSMVGKTACRLGHPRLAAWRPRSSGGDLCADLGGEVVEEFGWTCRSEGPQLRRHRF